MKKGVFKMPEDKLRGTTFLELTREEAASIENALYAQAKAWRSLAVSTDSYAYRKSEEDSALAKRISEACVYPAVNHE